MNQNIDSQKQITPDRLKRALIEAGLDPVVEYDRAVRLLIDDVSDRSIESVIRRIKPPEAAPITPVEKKKEEHFQRFNLNIRIQHITMAVSIIILIITGLPLKFHEAAISKMIMALMGGIDVSSVIHRIGATGLIFVGVFHLGYIILHREGRRDFILLLPRWKDLMDYIQMMKFYFGITEEKARFGRFSYIEKFDYWAVYWGMVIMISSGAMLWFQDIFLRFLPKFVMDIATEAHSDEALLATLAIVIWHFYNVHFSPAKFPMSKVFITGKLNREEMEEEHPLELEEIEKAQRRRSTDAKVGNK